jgi:regulator of ribonuclease activity A
MKEFTTPDLCDEHGDSIQVSLANYLSYGAIGKFYGQVDTVKCPDDNSIVKEVLSERGSKRILVIDAGNINHASMIGDQIASNAAKNEWVGIIVNGYVRDVEILKDIQIGILAKGSVPRKTVKRGLGSRSIDVLFDSVSISPGDWIYADSNGWIVSDKELIF